MFLDTVDSTNSYLKQLARDGAPSGTAVVAASQTGGRGRMGHSFSSPVGGIYLSYLMHPDTSPEITTHLTMWTAVTVRRVIEDFCGVKADIKYVNDLLYRGKKLCGILVELCEENLVIGIGLNVNANPMPEIACSLAEITGQKLDVPRLTELLVAALDAQSADWPDGGDRQKEYDRDVLKQI